MTAVLALDDLHVGADRLHLTEPWWSGNELLAAKPADASSYVFVEKRNGI